MAQELAMVAVGVISAFSVLAGSTLTWGLNNITTTENARRAERSASRLTVEGHYLAVMTSLEHFLRTSDYDSELNRELSAINARIDLFANEVTKKCFSDLAPLITSIQEKSSKLSPPPGSIMEAGEKLRVEWRDLLSAKKALIEAMSEHMSSLQSFKK